MRRVPFWSAASLLAVACLLAPAAQPQPATPKVVPRLEPVAETKLLMDGLANPNFQGLSKLLKEKPADAEAWRFARGRALLVGETGNLLMMRPPKDRDAQNDWMARGTELRDAAVGLARATESQDYAKSRAALAAVANACNHCHRSARVVTRVQPFADEEK